jgi:SP family general alpha glucoside:H+ symporter-like MFS transporter
VYSLSFVLVLCLTLSENLAGNSFSGYSTYFLTKAGVDKANSYNFAMGQYSINCVGVFGAWGLMALGIGRRSLYLYGLCGLFSALLVMGFLGLVPAANRSAGAMATGSMMIIWAAFYQLTVGTVCYSIVAEISTRRLQIKTIVLGRNMYNVVGIVCNILTPYMLNESAWSESFWCVLTLTPRLEQLCRLFLGRLLLPVYHLHLLPCARVQWPQFRRDRLAVRAACPCPQVCFD